MLTILTNRSEILKAQNDFVNAMLAACTDNPLPTSKNPRKRDNHYFYSKKYNIWFRTFRHPNRFWNGFGVGDPRIPGKHQISVEINPSIAGINRSIGGGFARNDKGDLYVIHRGKIRGFDTANNRTFLLTHCHLPLAKVQDGDQDSEITLISKLYSKTLVARVSEFVHGCQAIKDLTAEEPHEASGDNALLHDEKTGTRKAPNYSDEEVNLFHGDVVKALLSTLKANAFDAVRYRHQDVVIRNNKVWKTVFEVKMTNNLSDICKGVGQLLMHTHSDKKVKRVLLLPRKVSDEREEEINRLGIMVRTFDWNEKNQIVEGFNLPEWLA